MLVVYYIKLFYPIKPRIQPEILVWNVKGVGGRNNIRAKNYRVLHFKSSHFYYCNCHFVINIDFIHTHLENWIWIVFSQIRKLVLYVTWNIHRKLFKLSNDQDQPSTSKWCSWIQMKMKLPFASKTEFGIVYAFKKSNLFMTFGFIVLKTLNYLVFQSFDVERHLMKVIPETRRAH